MRNFMERIFAAFDLLLSRLFDRPRNNCAARRAQPAFAYAHAVNGAAARAPSRARDVFAGRMIALLFAAEDEGRTFDPTERKIQKARDEGRVAKTQELPSSLVLLGVMGIVLGTGSYIADALMGLFRYYFQFLQSAQTTALKADIFPVSLQIAKALWPVFVGALAAAILGNVVQFGWAPSTKPITPDFSRVSFNVGKWFEKMVSAQGLYGIGFIFVRLAVVGAIVFFNITGKFDAISQIMAQSFIEGITFTGKTMAAIVLESAAALLVLSFVDLQFQTYLFREQLKMTRQELKDELKESEGDVEVKRRIQSKMREFMSRNVKENVRKSDVIITNPTHFAVALRYDARSMTAPTVAAKGEDAMAFQIRRLAAEYGVPLIENKPLARALYADLEVGEEIPEQYYRAVVLIFEQVYKMKGVGAGVSS